ncbi:MAG: M6 family metalloprotease-like protein, partial [Bradymonadia bacterium]
MRRRNARLLVLQHGGCAAALMLCAMGCDDGASADPAVDANLSDVQVADAEPGDAMVVDGGRDATAVDAALADAALADAALADAAVSDAGPDMAPPVRPGVDPAECKLAFNPNDAVGVGFPRPAIRLPSTGTVRVAMVFVDFADVAAERTPAEVFAMVSPGAEDFFAANSYGRMDLILEPHLEWLRLREDAAHYGAGISTFEGHRAFIEEAVQAADPVVDFGGADMVVVMATPEAEAIPYGPTWTGVPGWEIEADGNAMTNGITSGRDLLFWSSQWLNHEMCHSMSLPDLYEYGGPGGFTRPFSLMDLIDSDAAELLAWERWQLGWIDDDQVLCAAYDTPITLTPIE